MSDNADIKQQNSFEDLLSSDLSRSLSVVPSKLENNLLYTYCERGHEGDIFLQQKVESITGKQIQFVGISLPELEQKIQEYQNGIDQLGGVGEEFGLELVVDDGEKETFKGLAQTDESEGPIVKLINNFIVSALRKRVSDIHIESHESLVSVKYRIDGVLYPATVDLDKAHHPGLVARLKVMAELDISEKRVPQDGRFKLRLGKKSVDFRISVIPGIYGENIVVRILDNYLGQNNQADLLLQDMGYSSLQLERFLRAINQPHGMVLVAGPTGSGKTTTLYTALQSINNGEHKIITIEDPVEYQLDGIMQIPVNLKKGLTFAKGLRSILRHDPDKILVGEIRDLETAEIAIQSALTGHLVFSTVHANSAFDVLARLNNIGVNLSIALSAINCIISQRLVRLNCVHCVVAQDLSSEAVTASGLDPDKRKLIHKGLGCNECNQTGYSGRKMISEILEITEEVRQSITQAQNLTDFKNNMDLVDNLDLRQAAIKLVYQSETSIEEIGRVTHS